MNYWKWKGNIWNQQLSTQFELFLSRSALNFSVSRIHENLRHISNSANQELDK